MRRIASATMMILTNVVALWQSALGLLQVFGFRYSGHARFVLTGSFDNPGPYGGLLAVLCAVLGAYVLHNIKSDALEKRILSAFSGLSCILCLILLPASMSRAAWLSLAVAAFVFGVYEMNLLEWMKSHRQKTVALVAVAAILLMGIFYMKRDSAIGRLHIWHMELRAIAQEPWNGHGRGSILGVYGETQAEYFALKQRPAVIVKVAGCPEYAFNEYLKIGVEYGIPAMLGVIAILTGVIVLLLRHGSPSAYGLIAFCVFAFFSYPLSAVRIKMDAEKEWESLRYLVTMELYEDAVEQLLPLRKDLQGNFRYLYDLGYSLHKLGKYDQSNEVLFQGSRISSDPLFHVMIAKNHQAKGCCSDAEDELLRAHHMVPGRIYPLSLLMDLKIRMGDVRGAVEIGERIKGMPVNEKVPAMQRMKNECIARLDSLKLLGNNE